MCNEDREEGLEGYDQKDSYIKSLPKSPLKYVDL